MNIKFLENKDQLIQYIKDDPDFSTTISCLSCLYSSPLDTRKIKALIIEDVDNINTPKKDNSIVNTLGNKAKELRSVYLKKENINTPNI